MGKWFSAPQNASEIPTDVQSNYPNVRELNSPDGAKFVFDATNNTIELVHSGGTAKISFDTDGNLTIETDALIMMKSTAVPDAMGVIQLGATDPKYAPVLCNNPKYICQITGAPLATTNATPTVMISE